MGETDERSPASALLLSRIHSACPIDCLQVVLGTATFHALARAERAPSAHPPRSGRSSNSGRRDGLARPPGRAAVVAVAFLAIIFTLAIIGLQGAVPPGKLQANSTSALVYVARSLGGSGGAQVMALALALSVIASTGTGIVIIARLIYGMASHRVLPEFLANVSRRFATPAAASLVVGLTLTGLTWLYLLTSSVQNVFNDLIGVTGLLYAAFYILTALAAIIYYRRRVFTSAWDALVLGMLPVTAAGFLGWVLVRSLESAPAPQIWSLAGLTAAGLILMLAARFVLRSPFFHVPRESDIRQAQATQEKQS